MVHVYNCHPFSSQQIVQVEQEPGLVCCGGGALFVVATGGCKVDAYSVEKEGCPLICRFATMGTVKSIQHSKIGDYLVTIEEKNSAIYLRAYTNWRYQAEEKARVGVRLLGHLLRGASMRGGVQMEIIEMPLSERPVAVACCSVTGDLLVGCENTLILFTLRRQNQQSLNQQNLPSMGPNTQQTSSQSQGQTSISNQNLSILDFERSVILHLPKIKPKQVALCGGYVAVRGELEVLVLKLDASSEPKTLEESDTNNEDHLEDQSDFLFLPRHQELLGDRAKDCNILVSIEKTGLEDRGQYTLSYVLFRRFTPDFSQGCSVQETQLHSLQLYPLFTSKQSVSLEEPACVFCFFSLPTVGYLYSLKGGVELLSAYQYPEKVLEAVLTDHLLHVITKSALQCFTVRCAAVAARIEDPYIDTTMKACPPCSLEVCALRMQLFIGLRSVCVYGRHVVLLSTADTETPEETERNTHRRGLSRKWTISSVRETSSTGHGWNIYVVDTVSPLALYQEMVEYSQRYAETNPQGQSLRHLLSEAHLLLRASLLRTSEQENTEDDPDVSLQTNADKPAEKQTAAQTDSQELEEALRQNCAQLGDSFSRGSQKDCHLALPYYRMSGLSVTEVMARNHPLPSSPHSYGPGFLFYLVHYLLEETEQSLSQEAADQVIDIFSQSEPSQLVSVCASPSMINLSPARTLRILQHLEDTAGVSVPLTITMATMMLLLDDLPQYTQLMERHAEMLLVYGFIEESKLLLHGGGGGQHTHIRPTALTRQMAKSQPGLLVAAMVALHENNKVQLEQADYIFKELGYENCLLVDFWEAMLMASSQEAVIQELLFRLTSVYIDRLMNTNSDPHPNLQHTTSRRRSLKSAEDLINSCSHYGALYPWLTVLSPVHTTSFQHQEALHKLQSLLCGPSLSVGSILPLMERLSEETLWGFSLHLLCATRSGQYDSSIEKLLDRCPQAIIAYANHQLQDKNMVLWWQKLLPELCNRTRAAADNSILLAALKETLIVVATETSPAEFLELIPDDGTAAYFLPHLLTCTQRHLLA
ncbi:Hermansky-Pudlak syndrome 3 protein isoform X2 [Micropterus salmoides]|uniref:Hermansky-Pudlak syndrome 3 protein isoform X2 n=1 Tax=Micropterus salmoides TaxID=27706 RepID=UPI0018ECFA80|nr:Hermansky-Pudlak syndrome 3 protein isoform X2 [Micropterus salmoides]